jgi:hypothetical protein
MFNLLLFLSPSVLALVGSLLRKPYINIATTVWLVPACLYFSFGPYVLIPHLIAIVFMLVPTKEKEKTSYHIDLDKLVFEQIEKDDLNITENGFHIRRHGRSATIYFLENLAVVPIYAEMPAVDYLDILIFGETQHIDRRYVLYEKRVEIISTDDRYRIQTGLIKWLSTNGLRHDIKVGT